MRIALIGGGPSALFLYKRLVESGRQDLHITLFEKKAQFGAGMPYSAEGANNEHVTNVSAKEIPVLVTSIEEWISTLPENLLQRFGITENSFHEYKVLPRLFFGQYLSAQFDLLRAGAAAAGIETTVCGNTEVTDLTDNAATGTVTVTTARDRYSFEAVVICTGHTWPKKHEGKVPGWFDSPYPPAKLQLRLTDPVAIRGSSLTAIDAIRTLARANGEFVEAENGMLCYRLANESQGFRLVLHSLGGLLPAIRVHLADAQLAKDRVLSPEEIAEVRKLNDGFIPLDYLFRRLYKEPLQEEDPAFFEKIKDLSLEEFVGSMMDRRERLNPFTLFKAEYAEAEKSIRRRQPVYWKEALATLSFALNYPAKYLPAEDMIRLKKILMPLISVVIAFVPQGSARELLALHNAGVLDLLDVDQDSQVEPQKGGGALYRFTGEDNKPQAVPYKVFVDCIGQPALCLADFPFRGLAKGDVVSEAWLAFRDARLGKEEKESGNQQVVQQNGQWYLQVPGLAINDNFQVVDKWGAASNRVYIMAVPYIGGYNPDYSGLDFCEAASARVVEGLLAKEKQAVG